MSSVAFGRKSGTGTFYRFAKSGVAVCIIGCALAAPARAATKVAVIEHSSGGGLTLCSFLTTNGYECTVFPASGPTESLDPFQVIVDVSNVWSDPTDMLADQMRARKGVITWGNAPQALDIIHKPTVRAWIGAGGQTGGSNRLLTTAVDPILGSRPPGTEIADCGDGVCSAVGLTEGHPQAKVLARFVNGNFVGLLRNTWEGGQSVYLTNFMGPGAGEDDIILNIFRILSNPIPTVSTWGALLLLLGVLTCGSLVIRHRRLSLFKRTLTPGLLPRASAGAIVFALLLGAPDVASAQLPDLAVATNEGVTQLRLGDASPFHTTQRMLASLRILDVPNQKIRVVLWEENAPNGTPIPFYAISLDGSKVDYVTDTSYELAYRFGRFDPSIAQPAVAADLLSDSDTNVYIVQYWTQPLQEFRSAIETLGGNVFHYLPMHAVLVRMSTDVRDQVAALPFVRWVGLFHPAYRLEEKLVAEVVSGTSPAAERVYTITLVENVLVTKNTVAARVLELGGCIEFIDSAAPFLYATLTSDQLRQIVRMDEVLFVGIRTETGTDMDLVRNLSGANHIEGAGGFSVEGVRGEVMDRGLCTDGDPTACGGSQCNVHQDFVPPPARHGGLYPNNCWHGNSVFGIVFGDGGEGGGDPTARGLLPDGIGIFASAAPFGLPPSGSRYAHTAELVNPALDFNCVFQTNSWGNTAGWSYDAESVEMDHIIFDSDLLICQSMGNFGWGSVSGTRPQAWAKNILSIGGIRHFNQLDHAQHEYCQSIMNCCNLECPPRTYTCCSNTCPLCVSDPSSCAFYCSISCSSCNSYICASYGPAPGGRVKPDLVHMIDCVWTTWLPWLYDDFGGTSAATPITCGYAGLVFQMWHEGVFKVWNGSTSVPTGTPNGTVFSDRPHATTVKAMLINTAYRYPLVTEPPLYR
ncbi:MAG: S8 family serine peptidase, partial [Verrucomicrobiota bacterium]